ncbi:MAG: aminomethyl-transferring glycine dehydrogenase subunit GcvPB [Candidatus Lindowbacteria bacterium]|nr:aminomethyl-transferring glycine dehydrogenase subunit GcvPB [Candidatus Lindowbacteria bacterium]
MGRNKETLLRKFHQAQWDEEIIFEMSVPGERGILVPKAEEAICAEVGDGLSAIPAHMRRSQPPALPEVGQMRVLRHFMRLSQQTMGADVTIDIGEGTCTMKYSPKVQEHLAARHPGMTEIHPLQDDDTLQGMLEIYYKLEQFLKEISGLDYFCLQPSSGSQAIYANACIIRAYHASRGDRARSEIVTTMFSHPVDAAAPATAGYKVITLMPGENGYPDMGALKAALSNKTAGIFITNPEDTGIYNPEIDQYVKAAHDAGALCSYDQANANGLLGIARAKEAGFDLCHFNIHKTFSAPHGCMGPAMGALGVTSNLAKFLPVPRVEFDGKKYYLDYNRPESIGRVRSFFGNAPLALKAYAWIMQHGADGLREAAEVSVLNNNYLEKKIREIPGVVVWYAQGKRRLEQVRYSWEKLMEDTGVGSDQVERRMVDYRLQHYFQSHHPHVVPEPFTLEPCESYSKDDIDEFAAVLRQISKEAYESPDLLFGAPFNAPIHDIPVPAILDPENIATTWRQYKKIKGIE